MSEQTKGLALITGGASGIGYGIARAAALDGLRVIIADIDVAALRESAANLAAEGAEVLTLKLDVGSESDWRRAASFVESHGNALQLLVNNAGVTGTGRHVGEMESAEWRRIIEINLTGLFLGTQTMLPLLRESDVGAHIVNTASMGALLPYAGGAGYTASKAGMLAFSESLRQELEASGIGVSVLLPARVRTRLFDTSARQLDPDSGDAMSRRAAQVTSLQRDELDPLAVGEQVLRAVHARAFYIFTHPELRPVMEARFGAMLAAMGDDPSAAGPAAAPDW